MELTVYRQSSKTRPDGTIVYKGEDARPYVDGQLLLVADGLGGAAAIRHQKIVPEIFESDKLMDALFADVYPDYSNETFVKYVTDSFFELFAVKDCYTDNINNIKKSGYFASRIVTAIVLHEMLYCEEYAAQTIFAALSGCESEEDKQAYLSEVGGHFKELIQTKIKEIAQKANLIYESSYAGLALLGSTLCATVFLEKEDCVQALYLTAGDSRPYVWSEQNGLCQVLKDQEGVDGGMTNYIKANENADFDIRCDYFCFEKPCVLFNASDGCFDSGRFLSQMGFEKLILDAAAASKDAEKMSEYLTTFFLEFGRHDDSSTIAFKSFGYETFEDFKQACQRRMNTLQAEYLNVLPDLLDVDYELVCRECERVFPGQLAALKEKFNEEQSVLDYCSDYVKAGLYAPYQAKIQEIDGRIEAEKQRIKDAVKAISMVVIDNYVKFKGCFECEDTFFDRFNQTKIVGADNKYQETAEEYVARLQKHRTDLDEAVATLSTLLDGVSGVGIPVSFDDYAAVELQLADDCEKKMQALFDFLTGLRQERLDLVRKLTVQRQEYLSKNRKLSEKHPEDVQRICTMLVTGTLTVDELQILQEEKARITEQLDLIAQANESIENLENQEKENAFKESCGAYWNEQYVEIIMHVLEDPAYTVNEELAEMASALIREMQEKTQGVQENKEKQKALFDMYETGYCLYIGGATDDDSRI